MSVGGVSGSIQQEGGLVVFIDQVEGAQPGLSLKHRLVSPLLSEEQIILVKGSICFQL